MTPSTQEHRPTHPTAALHRLLPNPATEHTAPALHRTSSLSEHHLFHDLPRPHPPALHSGREEIPVARRSTVHFPHHHLSGLSSPGSGTSIPLRSMSISEHQDSSGASSDRIPAHIGEMVNDHSSQHNNDHNASISREHVCLCPPDPKIPRPRNCKSVLCLVPSLSQLSKFPEFLFVAEDSFPSSACGRTCFNSLQHLFFSANINKQALLPRIREFLIRRYQRSSENNGDTSQPRPKKSGICSRKYVKSLRVFP